jgi:hypothetical protein
MSKTAKSLLTVLFILVIVSLGLNLYLIWQLSRLEQQARQMGPVVQQSLTQAADDLASFQQSTIKFDVKLKQEFPIQADIPFKETIDVPIKLTVPISQEIKTTIMLDLLKTGTGIPINIAVPINLDVPIDTTVPVVIDRTIPISTTVPLDLNVPVAIPIAKTDLAGYIEKLGTNLKSFNQAVDQMLGENK